MSPRERAYENIPGHIATLIWSTSSETSVPHDGVDASVAEKCWVPGPGGSRMFIVTFPPDEVMMDSSFRPEAAMQEIREHVPGLAEHFEPDGMHATPTIDYDIVLEGEIWLELDDGQEVHLKKHDVVIQNGTRHAWRNKGTRPATLAFVLIGTGGAA